MAWSEFEKLKNYSCLMMLLQITENKILPVFQTQRNSLLSKPDNQYLNFIALFCFIDYINACAFGNTYIPSSPLGWRLQKLALDPIGVVLAGLGVADGFVGYPPKKVRVG